MPTDTNWKRRLEIQGIRAEARLEVPTLMMDPLWVAGTVLYWGEGFKAQRRVGMANSDPSALQLFIRWIRGYVNAEAEFVCKLNLHYNNDEPAAREHWADILGLSSARFYRTFIKPEGTGHRKNHLPHGVCQVNVRRSSDSWHRIAAWIDALRVEWGTGLPSGASTRVASSTAEQGPLKPKAAGSNPARPTNQVNHLRA